mgnify:CR=1 FL=1
MAMAIGLVTRDRTMGVIRNHPRSRLPIILLPDNKASSRSARGTSGEARGMARRPLGLQVHGHGGAEKHDCVESAFFDHHDGRD